jgi:hypothetical protein
MDQESRTPAGGGTPPSRPGQHASAVHDIHDGHNGHDGHRDWDQIAIAEDDAWRARTRVFLTPVAAPSIMGLFGFMIATLMLGAWQAGWYGDAATPLMIWPFALFAGGVLQSVAAIVSAPATAWP